MGARYIARISRILVMPHNLIYITYPFQQISTESTAKAIKSIANFIDSTILF